MYYAAVLLIAALSAACGSPVNPHSLVVRKQAAKEDDSLRYKIVGGAPLSNDVPYMAQVFNVVAENESLQCGGTLISPTQVRMHGRLRKQSIPSASEYFIIRTSSVPT
jgi:hypothetical protein